MVTGTTRQVVFVKGTGEKLFEQAIFLVREDALSQGGVSEEALLKEAREVCAHGCTGSSPFSKYLWAGCGAGVTGFLWLLTAILL